MPRYSYHVHEELNLDSDGNAIGERIITLTNASAEETQILVPELEEWFPESATEFSVFDLTAASPVSDAEIEDHHYSRRVRWIVPHTLLPPHGQYQVRVSYKRSYVAHIARGYLHVTVGYASTQLSQYSLSLVSPSPIDGVHVRTLRPSIPETAQQYDLISPLCVRFPAREVSMNRQFYLDLALDVLGEVGVPNLPVVAFVTRQLQTGEWFPPGWEDE